MRHCYLGTIWLLLLLAALARGDVLHGRWTLEDFETVRDRPAVWADSLIACSDAETSGRGAESILGAPELGIASIGVPPGWTPSSEEVSWIELGFPRCNTHQIWIVEGLNPGALLKVVAVSGDDELLLYQRGRRTLRFVRPRVLWLELAQPMPIERLKIFMAPSAFGPGNLDAVALVPTFVAPTESISLTRQSLLPGESLHVVFNRVQQPQPGQTLGVRVLLPDQPADAPPLQWGVLRGGERELRLPVPTEPGSYIVERVDLLAESQDPCGRQTFSVVAEPDLALGFMLEPRVARQGEPLRVTFSQLPTPRDGEGYWLTVCPEGAADTQVGLRHEVTPGIAALEIAAPSEAGIYEMRLHARSPTSAFHVIHRLRLSVE